MKIEYFTFAVLSLVSFSIYAEGGLITQSKSNSCGAASLANLIEGTIAGAKVTEKKVIDVINSKNKSDDFTFEQLIEASKKMGYTPSFARFPLDVLPNLNKPVMILMGLNHGDFRHFVVLKSIIKEDGIDIAYIADPTLGAIRVEYSKLIEWSINKEFPDFRVMILKTTGEKTEKSTLYLPEKQTERFDSHLTIAQAMSMQSSLLTKDGQIIASYDFENSLANNLFIKSNSYVNSATISYGLSDDIQINGGFSYVDEELKIKLSENKLSINNAYQVYSLGLRGKLAEFDNFLGKQGVIFGATTSFLNQGNVFGGEVNMTGYSKNTFALFTLSSSLIKQFSNSYLFPEYTLLNSITMNKAINSDYLGILSFSVKNSKIDNPYKSEFTQSYKISSGLNYAISTAIQLMPTVSFSFGEGNILSFGLNASYIGGW